MDIKLQFTNIKVHYPLSIASQNRQTKKKHDHAPCGTRALNRKPDAIRKRSNNFPILFCSFCDWSDGFWVYLLVVVLNCSLAPSPAQETFNFPLTLHFPSAAERATDEIPLLPPQPAALLPARVCNPAGENWKLCQWTLTAFRILPQVCNAVYVRLNFTQPLCVCPPR